VTTVEQPRGGRRWPVLAVVAALLMAAVLYAAWPRRADLTAFDPNAMARLETSMWRAYYEKRYVALSYDLYAVSREQYNFSPLASLRIAFAAASAAKAFQPSTSRAEAAKALPALITYFTLLARGTPARFDIGEAARTELAWWQARREGATPEQYGLTIAHVSALVYGIDNDAMMQSGVVRAHAMAYRDEKDDAISEADWSIIADQLRAAYTLLKQSLSVRTAAASGMTRSVHHLR
jgi:hypothetical protein